MAADQSGAKQNDVLSGYLYDLKLRITAYSNTEANMPDFPNKSRCGPQRLSILHFSALFPLMLLHFNILAFPHSLFC